MCVCVCVQKGAKRLNLSVISEGLRAPIHNATGNYESNQGAASSGSSAAGGGGDGEDDDARHLGPPMTGEERVDCIYQDLVAVSSVVRRSMLVYNCVPSNYLETDAHTQRQTVRRVLWMAVNHPYYPVARRLIEQHHPLGVIHRSSMAGIPMRGLDADIVDLVVDIVWEQFLLNTERYPVYEEDGTRLETVVKVSVKEETAEEIEEEQQPVPENAVPLPPAPPPPPLPTSPTPPVKKFQRRPASSFTGDHPKKE